MMKLIFLERFPKAIEALNGMAFSNGSQDKPNALRVKTQSFFLISGTVLSCFEIFIFANESRCQELSTDAAFTSREDFGRSRCSFIMMSSNFVR